MCHIRHSLNDLSGNSYTGRRGQRYDSRKPRWYNGQHTGLESKRSGFYFRFRHNISHFHHTHDTGFHDQDLVQVVWFFNLPCLCMCVYTYILCMITACIYVIVSIKRLTIPGGASAVVCTDLSGKKLCIYTYRQVWVAQ